MMDVLLVWGDKKLMRMFKSSHFEDRRDGRINISNTSLGEMSLEDDRLIKTILAVLNHQGLVTIELHHEAL
jgi:hypothetical protein